MNAKELEAELRKYANRKLAEREASFFKTYDGGYGAGDQFLGLTVPVVRTVAKQFKDLSLAEVEKLLASPIHEERQAGWMVLTYRAQRADAALRKELYDFTMAHLDRLDNWDLVDGNAPTLIGGYLLDQPRDILYKLAQSDGLWERRVSILATFAFFRVGQFDDTMKIAKVLLHDKEDLIHKAVGWALREVGKRDRSLLVQFLDAHAHEMPRTMLRYAIEHFSPEQRQHYMALKHLSV